MFGKERERERDEDDEDGDVDGLKKYKNCQLTIYKWIGKNKRKIKK